MFTPINSLYNIRSTLPGFLSSLITNVTWTVSSVKSYLSVSIKPGTVMRVRQDDHTRPNKKYIINCVLQNGLHSPERAVPPSSSNESPPGIHAQLL